MLISTVALCPIVKNYQEFYFGDVEGNLLLYLSNHIVFFSGFGFEIDSKYIIFYSHLTLFKPLNANFNRTICVE